MIHHAERTPFKPLPSFAEHTPVRGLGSGMASSPPVQMKREEEE
jgi:hypothetical protein